MSISKAATSHGWRQLEPDRPGGPVGPRQVRAAPNRAAPPGDEAGRTAASDLPFEDRPGAAQPNRKLLQRLHIDRELAGLCGAHTLINECMRGFLLRSAVLD